MEPDADADAAAFPFPDVGAKTFVAFIFPSSPACPLYRIIHTQSPFASLSVRATVSANANGHDLDLGCTSTSIRNGR
jgi:hypothetical protein